MTSKLSQESNQQDPTASAAHLIQELLDRVIRASEVGSSQGEAPLGGPQLAGTVRRLIDEVRAEYRLLADREIAHALKAALGVDVSAGARQPEMIGRESEASNALDALEAMIMGTEPDVRGAHYHGSSVTELPSANDMPIEDQVLEETLYEGTVRLYVNADGNMQRVIRFVDDLGQRPQFRVLRMTGNPQRQGAEIDLGLREPTAFLELLRSMGHAAESLDASSGGVPQITVRLHALVTA